MRRETSSVRPRRLQAMRDRTRSVAIVASIVLGVAAVAVAKLTKTLWKRSIDRLIARLDDRRESATLPCWDGRDLEGLPVPVRRYFAYALTPGQGIVRAARVVQTGTFAMRPGSWRPFTAIEYFHANRGRSRSVGLQRRHCAERMSIRRPLQKHTGDDSFFKQRFRTLALLYRR